LLLYMASRSQHTGEWIIPALEKGKIVISDRYFDSTLAYQGAARKINLNIIDTITRFATFGLVPEITFLIDLSPEAGLKRIRKDDADRLENESLDFHRRVREGFLKIAEKEKRFTIIDGDKTVSQIHQIITNKIIQILGKEKDERKKK
ncbi:MAG: dTMP kinase, partial [Candidatus Cloacimonadota bacterium]